MIDLKHKGAIVAGTKRIGATVVKRLVAEGIRPAIVYRSSREEAQQLADSVAGEADRVVVIQADLTVEDEVVRAVETARSELGDLSFCINLASDYPRTPFSRLDAKAWDRGMATARGTYLLALHAARAMLDNPGPTRGHMVFFGDWAANETPYLDYLPYLTGKAAVHFLTRAFALELAEHGILVNAVLPGPTEAPLDLSAQAWQAALDQTPLARESSEHDIAEIITTLLRLETVTGENIRVDSGRHIAGTAKRKASS